MPPRPRRGPQPRGGPRARASTARRRVRTTSNASNVGAMATFRRRYRATRSAGRSVGQLHRRLQRMSLAGFLWLLITLVLAVVAVAGRSLGVAAFAGGSLAVTAGVEAYKRRKGRTGVPPRPSQTSTSRGKSSSRPNGGTGGTPVNLSGSSGTRPRVCSDACKKSTRDKSTCKCTAPSCEHGSLAGAGATP